MTKVQHFSGIDISKMSFNVCVYENGKYRMKKFTYTEEGMKNSLLFFPNDSTCIMESTGTYHCSLAYFLYSNGIKVCVVNPLSVKRFSQALMLRTKTDKADSKMLIEYGIHFQPKLWKPKADHFVELQQLINMKELLLKEERALKNQLEAINHSVVQNARVKEKIKEKLQQIESDLIEIRQTSEKITMQYEAGCYANLESIPGIGKKTTIVLIALTQGFREFENAKQVSSYFGLCPRIYESGTSVKGKSRICKMGMSLIRRLLYMCALSAKVHNKACRELYERLLKQGKQKKLALIAVANKLLKQAFSIIKNKTTYDENFLSKKLAF